MVSKEIKIFCTEEAAVGTQTQKSEILFYLILSMTLSGMYYYNYRVGKEIGSQKLNKLFKTSELISCSSWLINGYVHEGVDEWMKDKSGAQ